MGLLFKIARGDESPSTIDRLLDVENFPNSTLHEMAAGENLILSDCGFEDMKW